MIPNNPLTLRKILTKDGKTPPGSTGWGYAQFFKPMMVNDGGFVGRQWRADYDPKSDAWIVTGDGVQLHYGEIIETFPLEQS